jgi:hypothetical protein
VTLLRAPIANRDLTRIQLTWMVPSGFAAPYTAMLADRHSRRAILLWSSALRAAEKAVRERLGAVC